MVSQLWNQDYVNFNTILIPIILIYIISSLFFIILLIQDYKTTNYSKHKDYHLTQNSTEHDIPPWPKCHLIYNHKLNKLKIDTNYRNYTFNQMARMHKREVESTIKGKYDMIICLLMVYL
jgi:hypothetical protein